MKKRIECDFSWIKKRKLSILYSIIWKYDVYYGKKTLDCSKRMASDRLFGGIIENGLDNRKHDHGQNERIGDERRHACGGGTSSAWTYGQGRKGGG
jgi:hypothetical protein